MGSLTRDPTSDEATTAGTWSGSAGTRYTLVDDYPDTSSDALRHGTTAGDITFGFTACTVPTGATSISVKVGMYANDVTSGTNRIGARLKVGGSYYNETTSPLTNPGTTPQLVEFTWSTNPKTSAAWTVAEVNGSDGTNPLQAFGIYSTDANPQIDIWSIRMTVTYTDPITRKVYVI